MAKSVMVLSMSSVVMWEWPRLFVWMVRLLGAWVCPQSLRRAEVSLGMMTCRGIPCAWFAEEMRMVGLVPKKVSVSWGADQDLRLSRVRYRGEPSLYASSLVPGSLERLQACPSCRRGNNGGTGEPSSQPETQGCSHF